MPTTLRFNAVLRQWTEVFMGRSMRDFSAFMRNSGLSMPQVSALYRLFYQGQCGVTDIADHLDVSSAAASQMIERLVQQGLLERSEDPHDRRAKQIALSPAGRALMEASIEARVRWMAELTTVLSPEDQTTIIAALDALTSAAIRLDPYSQAREVEQ
jgi:DNA-binding MarR family transcriptional regulator